MVSLALLAACQPGPPEYVERSTQAVFEPRSSEFWALPFPHDMRLLRDGSPGLSAWPGAYENGLLEMWLETADARLDGFGMTTGVFVPLSGIVDPETLPPNAAATLEGDASVFLIDVDRDSPERGRRLPIDIHWLEHGDKWSTDRLLAAIPVFGAVRRPSTTYALVITDSVGDAEGEPLGRSQAFHDAFEDLDGASPRAARVLSPMREALAGLGIETARIVQAVPITTFDPNADLRAMAAWAETLPIPATSPEWAVAEAYESYQVLVGSFQVPTVQTGDRPYSGAGEGLIEWGEDGTPVQGGTQDVRLVLTIPRSPQPEGGFPITIYAHGSGGNAWQAVDRGPRLEVEGDAPPAEPGSGPAEWLARRGIATVGLDFNLHGARHDPPDTSGLVFYNLFGNVAATIDNFTVAAGLELVLLSRLLTELAVDGSVAATLDAGAATDGNISFDPSRIFAMGQSMGSTLTIPWATVDPRVRALVFSGAGGMLIEIAVTATEPVPLRGLLEMLLELESHQEIHIAHPLLHAMQNLWDIVDPVVKARHVAAETHPGVPPKSFLMPAGVRDGYFHPRAQAAVAASLRAPLAGEAVEPTLPAVLELLDVAPATYPVENNLGDEVAGRATAAVTHFNAPHDLGHYVTFNQERVIHQYTCFLASAGKVVAAPKESATAPCE